MKKYSISLLLVLLTVGLWTASSVQAVNKQSKLYSQQEAESLGLTRSWFSQITLNVGQEKIKFVTIQDNVLFVVTDGGYIQTLNAETGTTLWQRRFGNKDLYTSQAAANSKVVGVVNGTTLYLFDRFNGKLLIEKELNGNPAAGPQLSERYVFVPMISQRMFALPIEQDVRLANDVDTIYALQKVRTSLNLSEEITQKIIDEENQVTPIQYQLKAIEDQTINSCPLLGLSLVQPTLTTQSMDNDYISWTTENGWLLIARLSFEELNLDRNGLELVYRIAIAPQTMYVNTKRVGNREIETSNSIAARPLFVHQDDCVRLISAGDYKEKSVETTDESDNVNPAQKDYTPAGGMILCGSDVGYVFAVNDVSGDVCWKFHAGSAVEDSIISDGELCFVPSAKGFLFAVSLKNGIEKWVVPQIEKPIAVSKSRLYAIDKMGNLVVLDKKNGKRIQALRLDGETRVEYNSETDRLFLVSNDGLIQSMHETTLEKPIRYAPSRRELAQTLSEEMVERLGKSLLDPPKAPLSPALSGTKDQSAPDASVPNQPAPVQPPQTITTESDDQIDAPKTDDSADPFGNLDDEETTLDESTPETVLETDSEDSEDSEANPFEDIEF